MKLTYLLLFFITNFQVFCQNHLTDSLLLELQKENDDAIKARICDKLFFHFVHKDNSKALSYLESAIEYAFEACDNEMLGKMYTNKGAFLSESGKSILAMQSLNEALKFAELAGDNVTLLNIYGNVGGIYLNRKENEKARFYYEKILSSLDKANDKLTFVVTLNNLAILHGREQQHEEALKYLKEAIQLEDGETDLKATLYDNTGMAYFGLNQLNKAMEFYEKALLLNTQLGNQFQLLHTYLNISKLQVKKEEFAEAIQSAKAALQIAEKEDYLEDIATAHREISNAYKELGNEALSLQHLEAHITALTRFNDDLYSSEIAQLQEAFDVAIKEQEILALRQNQDILAVLINKKSIQLMTRGVLIILLLFLLGLVFHFYKAKERAAKALEFKNRKIETLIKELHHRVKNNLQLVNSLLSIQYSRTEDTETKQTIKEGQARLEAMALIHKNLSIDDDISGLNMQGYLKSLTQNLTASYGFPTDTVHLDVTLSNPIFNIDQAVPLGLIVNELVSNAFKYAFEKISPAKLWLTLLEDKNWISLIIKDNGTGIPDHENLSHSNTFGLKLVNMLANQLNAKLIVAVDKGTSFKLIFKKT